MNNNRPKISIVATYYNRKGVFYQTLKSVSKSKFKDFEFIVVDDGSSPEHRVEDLVTEFPFLKIVRIEPINKWYSPNSCVPYNEGIRIAKGEIIVLQNAECFHVHDILTYFKENINDLNYISISAYGLNSELTKILPQYSINNTVPDFLKGLPQVPYRGIVPSWYNHSIIRPTYFHFCSAITRSNMKRLNGFDERYATGLAYEDSDFLHRVRLLGLDIKIIDDVTVIHQYHTPTNYNGNMVAYNRNRVLYITVTEKLTNSTVNPNKNIFNEE